MAVFCWDFDGTLVYSDHLWSNSVQKAILDTVPEARVKFENIRKCNTTGFSWQSPENSYCDRTGELWWEDMNCHFYKSCLLLGLDRQQSKSVAEKVRAIIKRPENYYLFNDAKETLEYIRSRGYINVLLSNNYPDLKDVTDALGLSQYFENMVISALVGYEKPRKEIFEIVKSLYPDENDFYMIGDNVSADIAGGKNVGMKTVLVHKGYDSRADYCFENLSEIKNML